MKVCVDVSLAFDKLQGHPIKSCELKTFAIKLHKSIDDHEGCFLYYLKNFPNISHKESVCSTLKERNIRKLIQSNIVKMSKDCKRSRHQYIELVKNVGQKREMASHHPTDLSSRSQTKLLRKRYRRQLQKNESESHTEKEKENEQQPKAKKHKRRKDGTNRPSHHLLK